MFDNAKKFWSELAPRARTAIMVGVVAVAILTAVLLMWAFSGHDEALFTELRPEDAATIVAELEKQKIPYRLTDGGSKIMVDQSVVHKTRLKLMGKGVPLQGGVGFEVFDNSDFGMTEFAQKINYQRALQGELARTIMAFDEIKFARVHLVMPENSIFKQNKTVTKASVTLVMKDGRELGAEQVLGIQRLVAAAVPSLDPGKVTVLDQRGVVLSRIGDDDQYAASGRLEKKKEVETYLTRKLTEVLDRTFGPGQAVVSVDATLNLEEIKTTNEEVLAAPGNRGEATGVVTRKRLTNQAGRTPVADGDYVDRGGSTTTEVEYQVGRKIQQIVETPGTVRRLSVSVLVPQRMDEQKVSQLREVISATIGINSTRGDVIAVQSLDQFEQKTRSPTAVTGTEINAPAPQAWWRSVFQQPLWLLLAFASLMILVLIGMLIRGRVGNRSTKERPLSAAERDALLLEIKRWLDNKTPRTEGGG